MRTEHSPYLRNIFRSNKVLRSTVRQMVITIKQHRRTKDCVKQAKYIACRGVSGLAIAAPVAYSLGMGLIVVRKPKEESHASFGIEGMPQRDNFRYIIVDDFVSSGKTLKVIQEEICIGSEKRGKCAGAFTYNDSQYYEPKEIAFRTTT